MTIRLLRTLIAVADNRTFSAAASVVHVTHAAVSQQMHTLEADLGLTLFDRAGRTRRLTPMGHQVVERARQIVIDYDNLVPAVVSANNQLVGELSIGAIGTTLTGLAPQTMAVLKSRFPDLWLQIRPGLTASLLADIARNTLDAAIVTKPHLIPEGIMFQHLADEQLQLIAAPEETQDDPDTLLNSRPFIRFNRTAVVGTLIDNWIVSQKIHVAEAMELDSAEAIASMVGANLGVSIVPDLAVKPNDGIALKRISLGKKAPKRELGLAFKENHPKQQAIQHLLEALHDVIAKAKDAS